MNPLMDTAQGGAVYDQAMQYLAKTGMPVNGANLSRVMQGMYAGGVAPNGKDDTWGTENLDPGYNQNWKPDMGDPALNDAPSGRAPIQAQRTPIAEQPIATAQDNAPAAPAKESGSWINDALKVLLGAVVGGGTATALVGGGKGTPDAGVTSGAPPVDQGRAPDAKPLQIEGPEQQLLLEDQSGANKALSGPRKTEALSGRDTSKQITDERSGQKQITDQRTDAAKVAQEAKDSKVRSFKPAAQARSASPNQMQTLIDALARMKLKGV